MLMTYVLACVGERLDLVVVTKVPFVTHGSAGIDSVDKGQMEAARSLGIGYLPTMRKVILPQAIRTMIPSYINQFVITLKDTSILSVLGIAELTQSGRIIIAGNYKAFEMWLIVGIIYFIVIMALTKLSDRLERRLVK